MFNQNDYPFYMQIWNERSHVCECCGETLFAPHTFNFHHILEKREKDNKHDDYSVYRHCRWNIMLLCWQCHDAYERNPVIKRLEPIRERRITLLNIHNFILENKINWDEETYWFDDQDISNIKNYIPCSKLYLN